MLAPFSMINAEYQLWRGGIAYAKKLLGDLNYGDFSEDHLMSPFPIGVCTFSFPSFPSLYLAYLAHDGI